MKYKVVSTSIFSSFIKVLIKDDSFEQTASMNLLKQQKTN